MVSAAEQLARNISFSTFGKAKELQARIWFTLIALIVYRIGTQVPIPGIDTAVYAAQFGAASKGILGMWNTFSGGAVERMAIFALNVMPYISASIIVQILTTAVPALERLKKEGESGRKQINQYTRYLTVLLALAQAFMVATSLNTVQTDGTSAALDPGFYFLTSTVVTLVGGTVFLMWLGEQVTARGVGNGISLIIFAGIVAELPNYIVQTWQQLYQGSIDFTVILAITALSVMMVLFIVFIERSQRRLLIQYPKRQQGNRMVGGESSFLPLKVNSAGVIPPIFASSLLMLPQTMASMNSAAGAGAQAGWWGETLGFINAYLGVGQRFRRPVRSLDHLLLLLLHGHRLQRGRDGREPAEVWRVHSGLSPRQANRGIFRLRSHAPHRYRLGLYRRRLRSARDPARQSADRKILYRRHLALDRRIRHHGHCRADPVAPDRSPVRRHDQAREAWG